jgi:hypothetical protein
MRWLDRVSEPPYTCGEFPLYRSGHEGRDGEGRAVPGSLEHRRVMAAHAVWLVMCTILATLKRSGIQGE